MVSWSLAAFSPYINIVLNRARSEDSPSRADTLWFHVPLELYTEMAYNTWRTRRGVKGALDALQQNTAKGQCGRSHRLAQ